MAKKSTAADPTTTPAAKRTNGSRIYIILEADKPKALVEATSGAAALRHFTGADKYAVRYAEQTDLFAAAKANLEVQKATATSEDPA